MKPKRKVILWWIALPVLLVAASAFLFRCYWNWAWNSSFVPTEIQQGFSTELLEELETRYGITVPEEAQFIKGYNLPGWQDPHVAILFAYPIEEAYEPDDNMSVYVHQMLKLGTRYSEIAGKNTARFGDAELYAELGGQMEWQLDDENLNYTYISYNIEKDKLVIRFLGWRPSTSFP